MYDRIYYKKENIQVAFEGRPKPRNDYIGVLKVFLGSRRMSL